MIDIITPVIIDVIKWIIPHGFIELQNRIKQRPLREFYNNLGNPIYLVFPPRDMDNILPGTHIFDLMGAMELQDRLIPLGYAFERRRSNLISERDLQQGIISIGGPISNKISRSLLSTAERRYGIVYKFGGADNHTIVNTVENEPAYKPSFQRNRKNLVEVDYGIVTRIKNPYDLTKKHDAIIVAGSFGWGTQACLRVISDIDSLKYIMKKVKSRPPYFQAVCMTQVDEDGVPLTPELVKESIVEISG